MTDLHLRSRVATVAVVGAFLSLTLGGLSCHSVCKSFDAGTRARTAADRESAARALLTRVRDMEAAQMGYLLSGPAGGGENYLIAYRRAAADLGDLANTLSRTTDGDHERVARARKVAALALVRRGDCAFVFAECEAGRKLYAVAHVRDGEGRRQSDWFAAEAAELCDAEAGHGRDAEAAARHHRNQVYLGLAFWLSMTLVGCATLLAGCFHSPDSAPSPRPHPGEPPAQGATTP